MQNNDNPNYSFACVGIGLTRAFFLWNRALWNTRLLGKVERRATQPLDSARF